MNRPALLTLSIGLLATMMLATTSQFNFFGWCVSLALLTLCVAIATTEVSSNNAFSPAALYSYLFAIHFAIPGLLLSLGHLDFVYSSNGDYAQSAMIYTIGAWLAFQGGYKLSIFLMPSPTIRAHAWAISPNYSREWNSDRLKYAIFLLLTVGWGVRMLVINSDAYFQSARAIQGQLEGPFYALIRMLEQLPLMTICMLSVAYWGASEKNSKSRRMLLAAFLAEMIYWVPTGRKEAIILTCLLPLVARYLLKGRLVSIAQGVVLLLLTVTIFPLAHYYRLGVELEMGMEVPIIEVVSNALDLIAKGAVHSNITTGEVAVNRLSLIEPVAACMRLIDSGEWPLFLGESYAIFFVGLIPRFLWSDKPVIDYGPEFSRASGMLGIDDWVTSISVTLPGEAYLNFAWGGLIAMSGIGLLFGILYRQMKRSRFRLRWIYVYVASLPMLLFVGGNFGLYVGGLGKIVIFTYLIGALVTSHGFRSTLHTHRPENENNTWRYEAKCHRR